LVEPNPMVGAVIVKDGRVVGEGYHERFGGPHAEVNALRRAGEAARGATMYVTLEPCDHEGKTPACAPMVARAGLSRVVVACLDPTAATPCGGMRILRAGGMNPELGLCRDEAVRLNAGFFKLAATGRPLLIAKWAMSADGKMATRTGSSRWISSEASRRVAHELRGRVDCIVVGRRTVEVDDPMLTCRDAERRRVAARLVICGRQAPPLRCRLANTVEQAPVILAYPAGSPPPGLDELAGRGCEALPVAPQGGAAGRLSIGALLDALGERRMTNVLLEGGAETLGSFFDAGAVDRVMVFVAPLIIGGSGAAAPVGGRGAQEVADALRLRDWRVSPLGPDVLIEGALSDPLEWAP